jgi:hypothetical protein
MSGANWRNRPGTGGGFPRPLAKNRYRIQGPYVVNGMSVWRVWDLRPDRTDSCPVQIGPDCFSYEEAWERAEEAASGRAAIWMGHTKLVKKAL